MATTKIRQSPKLPAEKRRQQLLASAHRLFREHGYLGTSTEEIARHAGLTKGALYFHFKSKEDILFALVKAMVEDHKKVLASLPTPFTPSKFVELHTSLRSHSRFMEFRSLLDIMGQALRIPRIRKYMNAEYRRTVKLLARQFQPAYGLTPKESEQLAVMLMAMSDGLSVRCCLDERLVDMKTQLRLLRSLFDRVEAGELKCDKD